MDILSKVMCLSGLIYNQFDHRKTLESIIICAQIFHGEI
ncbi:hypothetical protein P20495_1264 [Pseudoalteromonas sp. BSi20495]|nr:hypothetical protein P20495_1264 [Pseudoalteromonas sp. BSi20495]